jgi:aminocarboxymuconate-semialdehyde decarboxylase
VFDPNAVRFLVQQFGASQICVGTDYPFALGDWKPFETLEKSGLDQNTLSAITSTNARRFLGLPAAPR